MMIRKKNLSALVGPEICNKELNEVYGMDTPYQSIHNPVDSEAPIYDLQKKEIVFLLNENNISFPFSSDHAVVRLVALVCTEYSTDIPLAINFHHPVGGDMLTIPSLVECSGIENGKCVDILLNTSSQLLVQDKFRIWFRPSFRASEKLRKLIPLVDIKKCENDHGVVTMIDNNIQTLYLPVDKDKEGPLCPLGFIFAQCYFKDDTKLQAALVPIPNATDRKGLKCDLETMKQFKKLLFENIRDPRPLIVFNSFKLNVTPMAKVDKWNASMRVVMYYSAQ